MDLVIEAIVEDMAVKKKLFASLSARCADHTILATNTSALSVAEMAAAATHPERVIGLHFFNPPHLMPLVEVVAHDGTSDEVTATAMKFVQTLGKTPVLVKDSPGFVVNRILMPYLMGAVTMAAAMPDPWIIDTAMTEFGLPMGPLRLLDEIGFDVAIHVAGTLGRAFPDRMKSSPLLSTFVAGGMLGKKTGKGFYLHEKGTARRNMAARKHLYTTDAGAPRAAAEIAGRLVELMRDEAQRCLDEGVASSAADINLAMILGTGFPPFRKLL
jgi:3-hydroxyacyl-CoA dehydrogenase/enoyl-CoA hydratase/3-hydroxybutyryl-CoA epimerase